MAYPQREVVPVAGASQTINFDHDSGASEVVVIVTASTATVNLPNATGWGSRVVIKKLSSTGTVTVQPPAGVTIDGAANFSLAAQWKFCELLADGNCNWILIGSN